MGAGLRVGGGDRGEGMRRQWERRVGRRGEVEGEGWKVRERGRR